MEQKVCSLTIRGETKQYPLDTTFQQIADEYQKQFENKIVLVKFQNDLKELSQSVLRDGSLEFVTADQKPGKDTYRRSLTLLMETAAWKLYPNLELLVQHSIGQGYYCEFRHKDAICVPDRKMLSSLKEKMQDFSVPSLITRTTNDVTQIQMIVAMGLQMMIKAPIMAVWAVIKILGKSWELSAVTGFRNSYLCDRFHGNVDMYT
mgnify:CR=1 FL=1